jgi:outer membrane protein assembly factor BamA
MTLNVLFGNTNDSIVFTKYIKFPVSAKDSSEMFRQLRGGIKVLQNNAYLEAAFDSLNIDNQIVTTKFHLGNRYEWTQLTRGNLDNYFLNAIGYSDRFLSKKPFFYREITDIEEKLLAYAENNGYPFAQVWLDSILIKNGKISAALMLEKGAMFYFDSLRNIGTAKINPRFLYNFLNLKRSDIFNKKQILNVKQRLKELPYLVENQPFTLHFNEAYQAALTLFLNTKKASFWDFLIGVQPTANTDGNRKFSVTFNGKADFQNLLGAGERFYANFENLRPQSPRLNLKISYPYPLSLPFGFDGSFDLYKRDTTYIETQINLGGQYFLGGNDYIKLFWNRYNSRNLLINANEIINTRKLPQTLDIQTNTLGSEFSKSHLDYRFNPRRGWAFQLRGGIGRRAVLKNADILNLKSPIDTAFKFLKLYDTVALRSFQYRFDTKFEYFIPVFKRSTIKLGMTSGLLYTSAPIAQNEQYRIGGNRLLRGFDEESVFTTRHIIATLEYRLLIGRNSYLYAFSDAGYIENVTRTVQNYDTPYGFGAGITFETKVGLFGVSLAVGSQQGNVIDLRNVKTHFGYISIF